uniref:Uncharacterized protein n=1 Tax=Panagrolaimus davidi TaxID=227884 RepID=A0A914QCM7_9BILA
MQAFLSPEYKEKLNPTYRRKLENLEEKFSATLDLTEKQRILDEFSEEYLMPRQYWDEMICLYFVNNRNGYDEASKNELEKLRERAIYQFYYDNDEQLRDQIRINLWFQAEQRKLLKSDTSHHNYRTFDRAFIKFKERQLTYPHQALDDCYQFYERYSSMFLLLFI